jgi:hypothetical protein
MLLTLVAQITACNGNSGSGTQSESNAKKDLFSKWANVETGEVMNLEGWTFGGQTIGFKTGARYCYCEVTVDGNEATGNAVSRNCVSSNPTFANSTCNEFKFTISYSRSDEHLIICEFEGTCVAYQ